MMNHRTRKYVSLLMALGVVGIVPGCGDGLDELPASDSLEATYQAVEEVVDCSESAPEPAVKLPRSGRDTGESVMCTSPVEVLWFHRDEARENVYEVLADTAGAVYLVKGRNWFVTDGAEVMVGAVLERRIDMEQLADALDARYTVGQ